MSKRVPHPDCARCADDDGAVAASFLREVVEVLTQAGGFINEGGGLLHNIAPSHDKHEYADCKHRRCARFNAAERRVLAILDRAKKGGA
jgi:hypothetical protein